jgi:Flp pilus assembly protein TadD
VGRDYGKAQKLLESAYEGGIKDLALLNNYAVSLMASGDSEAEKIFKEAVQIGGTDATVSFNYALYLTYVKKDFKEAGEALDKIRFIGMPANKKSAVARMEETISGSGSVEKETP